MKTLRRLAVVTLCYVTTPGVSRASVWDGDLAMVTQLLAIVSQLEQSYRMLTSQLEQLQANVRLAKDASRRLSDAQSFTELSGVISNAKGQYESIKLQAAGIKYQMTSVRGQFDTLFPKAKDIPTDQLHRRRSEWQQEVRSSSRTAIAAQSVLENTDKTNRNVSRIAELSQTSGSQMQQMQLMNQLLVTVSSQMADLTRVIATSNRALSTQLAAQSSQEQLSLEHSRRMWDLQNYRKKPPAPSAAVRTRLPRPGSR